MYFYIKIPLAQVSFEKNKSLRPLGLIMGVREESLAAILH